MNKKLFYDTNINSYKGFFKSTDWDELELKLTDWRWQLCFDLVFKFKQISLMLDLLSMVIYNNNEQYIQYTSEIKSEFLRLINSHIKNVSQNQLSLTQMFADKIIDDVNTLIIGFNDEVLRKNVVSNLTKRQDLFEKLLENTELILIVTHLCNSCYSELYFAIDSLKRDLIHKLRCDKKYNTFIENKIEEFYNKKETKQGEIIRDCHAHFGGNCSRKLDEIQKRIELFSEENLEPDKVWIQENRIHCKPTDIHRFYNFLKTEVKNLLILVEENCIKNGT